MKMKISYGFVINLELNDYKLVIKFHIFMLLNRARQMIDLTAEYVEDALKDYYIL